MTLNEIKKEIYKQQPTAYFQFIRLGVAYYETQLKETPIVLGGEDDMVWKGSSVKFEVPTNDMGSVAFFFLLWKQNISYAG